MKPLQMRGEYRKALRNTGPLGLAEMRGNRWDYKTNIYMHMRRIV